MATNRIPFSNQATTNRPIFPSVIPDLTITDTFAFTNNPTSGYVLTSDADGNATWQASGGGGSTTITGETNQITVLEPSANNFTIGISSPCVIDSLVLNNSLRMYDNGTSANSVAVEYKKTNSSSTTTQDTVLSDTSTAGFIGGSYLYAGRLKFVQSETFPIGALSTPAYAQLEVYNGTSATSTSSLRLDKSAVSVQNATPIIQFKPSSSTSNNSQIMKLSALGNNAGSYLPCADILSYQTATFPTGALSTPSALLLNAYDGTSSTASSYIRVQSNGRVSINTSQFFTTDTLTVSAPASGTDGTALSLQCLNLSYNTGIKVNSIGTSGTVSTQLYTYGMGYSGGESLFGSLVEGSSVLISTANTRFAIGSRLGIPLQLGTFDCVGLQISPIPSAVNYLVVNPSASGSGVSLTTEGGDSDIDIALIPKGTGNVYMTSLLYDKSPVSGYILTTDANGVASWSNPTGAVLPTGLSSVSGQPLVWDGFGWVAASSSNFTLNVGRSAGETSSANYCTNFGSSAGQSNQEANSTAIGVNAGQTNQGTSSVAVGFLSQTLNCGDFSTAIGAYSAQENAGAYSTCIGFGACGGTQNAGLNSVSLGALANAVNNNSIVLNASGSALTSSVANSFYVSSVRSVPSSIDNIMCYNTTSKEVSYTGLSDVLNVGENNANSNQAYNPVYLKSDGTLGSYPAVSLTGVSVSSTPTQVYDFGPSNSAGNCGAFEILIQDTTTALYSRQSMFYWLNGGTTGTVDSQVISESVLAGTAVLLFLKGTSGGRDILNVSVASGTYTANVIIRKIMSAP
jgi:hypothetical protein